MTELCWMANYYLVLSVHSIFSSKSPLFYYRIFVMILSRYSWAVRPLPQDLEKSKEDRWGITAHKSPIGSTNHQWGMKKTPTDGSFTLLKITDKKTLDFVFFSGGRILKFTHRIILCEEKGEKN
ncbi:hypothetical protein [Bacillus pseudomycoides]|nr:hypothetical protein [Bacillus pseudomycoides]MED1475456.1 hypothetical protein [Bacillus pseudomycoides]MED4654800.1 hypothetical protein [Bacillus pseudomycoides]